MKGYYNVFLKYVYSVHCIHLHLYLVWIYVSRQNFIDRFTAAALYIPSLKFRPHAILCVTVLEQLVQRE